MPRGANYRDAISAAVRSINRITRLLAEYIGLKESANNYIRRNTTVFLLIFLYYIFRFAFRFLSRVIFEFCAEYYKNMNKYDIYERRCDTHARARVIFSSC